MRKLFDRSMAIFLVIGLGNTVLSFIIMQFLYAVGAGYWLSSAVAFAVTSVASYILNKRFSFDNHDSVRSTLWRFALVISVCYFFAYLIARPATAQLLRWLFPDAVLPVDQIAMLTGQVLFTAMNYFGQRFFAFGAGKADP